METHELSKSAWIQSRARVSLRLTMVFVLVLGCGLAWLVHRARVQRDAVAAFQRAGDKVWYDWEWNNGPLPNGKPKWPKWLLASIGVDYLSSVVAASVRRSSDTELMHLKNLAKLECLLLNSPSVSDGGLVHLEGLRNLRALNLQHSNITDTGLMHLENLTSLQELGLGDTDVGDAGLSYLKRLTGLRELGLGKTRVTDTGVKALQEALPGVKIRR
jgi:internalin A